MAYQSCQSDQKLLPPLDIGATLEQRFSSLSSAADEITMVTWEGCQKYQTRCVARNALLTAALTSPSKVGGFLHGCTVRRGSEMDNRSSHYVSYGCQIGIYPYRCSMIIIAKCHKRVYT